MSDWAYTNFGDIELIDIPDQGIDDIVIEPHISDNVVFIGCQDDYNSQIFMYNNLDDDIIIRFNADPVQSLHLYGIFFDLNKNLEGTEYVKLLDYIDSKKMSSYDTLPPTVSVKIKDQESGDEFLLQSANVGDQKNLQGDYAFSPFQFQLVKVR